MLQYPTVRAALNYIGEVRVELQKVIWPKRSEVVKLTLTVILITAIVGVYVGLLDYGFASLLEQIIK
ncbi:MAG TPA: preprotein translocase subunit SecE [Patescibacteria group bacterium]|uniref:Protein translocase subunit SecE n=1 Tax=Candidatus Woesebacteria bacterium RIFCSPHIGHO2_01_FULL_41_10 TaxID=1802500 RepID=A0A1F7YNQ4_9BACT|nr:MAG: preprotein translocase subunit SecE [Candidatus Woesebacteria bacterium RIFCSPHIGHO2_01_FULL_41_10]HLD01450.1 preprotein translocase subunit SecE [Patescibacteria group bacterium]